MDDTIKILFWNVHKFEKNIKRALDFGASNNISIIAVLESPSINELMGDAGAYRLIPHTETDKKNGIELYIHTGTCNPRNYFMENQRFVTIRFKDWDLNMVVAHLPSNIRQEGEENRRTDISAMIDSINRIEDANKSKNTVIIGDLNIGLFDKQMYEFSGMNARLFCYQMRKQYRSYHEQRRDLFYNPMLKIYENYESETAPKGTHFYQSNEQQWFCYDHVLMKYPVIARFLPESLKVLNALNGEPLIRNNKLVLDISDHLPIYFEIKMGGENKK